MPIGAVVALDGATLASAGHPLPRLLRRAGTVERIGQFGTLAGCFPEFTATDRTVRLTPCDAVVFYTDGLIETGLGDDVLGGGRRHRPDLLRGPTPPVRSPKLSNTPH